MYKYDCEDDMKKLDMLFASIEDPNQTMDSIINYIANEQGNFRGLDDWEDFLEVVKENCQAGKKNDEISVGSWRKFNRIIRNSIYNNPMFGRIADDNEQTRLEDSLKHIKKNEIHVIDIAKLNEDMQGFVFGDGKWIFVIVIRTGQQRPYKSPEHVTSKKEKKYNYYIMICALLKELRKYC